MSPLRETVLGAAVSCLALLWGLGCGTADVPAGEQGPRAATVRLAPQRSGVSERLQAIDPLSPEVVWASGLGGHYLRTLDGGESWLAGTVPGAEGLQFRDVHAHGSSSAHLLAAGSGSDSRIYRTDDGGESWTLQWQNPEETGFYDCFDFWDAISGLVYGDSIEGELRVLRTLDGGATWSRLESVPSAVPDEGGFAASGTCLVVGGPGHAWIGTGAGAEPRVLRTEDYGDSWGVSEVPLVSGGSAGVFSLVVGAGGWLVALGGDLEDRQGRQGRVAVSSDGGVTWHPAGSPSFRGPIYGGAIVPSLAGPTLVAVGPGGISSSTDAGATWEPLSEQETWSVAFAAPTAGWAVGPDGSIVRLGFTP